MRYFTLTKEEFEQVVYPAAIGGAAKTMHEHRLLSKAMDALEAAGDLTPMSILEMRQEKGIPVCQMIGASADFALEDAVHEALMDQVEKYVLKMPMGMARVAQRIADRIKAAPAELPASPGAV